MTDDQAITTLTNVDATATWSIIRAAQSELQEWARGLTAKRRTAVVDAISERYPRDHVEHTIDRLLIDRRAA